MTPQDIIASIGVGVAVLTVIVTVAVARDGWKRDRDHRDAALEADCVKALCTLIQARYAPLSGKPWSPFDGAVANEHHTTAIASMNAVSEARRQTELVRFVARQGVAIQEESVRYRQAPDHRQDLAANKVGCRRGAIFDAATMMQEELLLWQADSDVKVRSFWWHYSEQLLLRSGNGCVTSP